jgi:hypothetical protein
MLVKHKSEVYEDSGWLHDEWNLRHRAKESIKVKSNTNSEQALYVMHHHLLWHLVKFARIEYKQKAAIKEEVSRQKDVRELLGIEHGHLNLLICEPGRVG